MHTNARCERQIGARAGAGGGPASCCAVGAGCGASPWAPGWCPGRSSRPRRTAGSGTLCRRSRPDGAESGQARSPEPGGCASGHDAKVGAGRTVKQPTSSTEHPESASLSSSPSPPPSANRLRSPPRRTPPPNTAPPTSATATSTTATSPGASATLRRLPTPPKVPVRGASAGLPSCSPGSPPSPKLIITAAPPLLSSPPQRPVGSAPQLLHHPQRPGQISQRHILSDPCN